MSDIDPNAADKLVVSAFDILKKKSTEMPAIRNLIAAIKATGESTEEMEKQMDAVEALVNNVLKTSKLFPKV